VFHSLNEAYGVTIVIVTHDIRITNKVERVVTIRDGRTSLETIREPRFADVGSKRILGEFIILDKAGRLQLPKDYIEKLNLKGRVRVLLDDDHINVWPGESPEREDK